MKIIPGIDKTTDKIFAIFIQDGKGSQIEIPIDLAHVLSLALQVYLTKDLRCSIEIPPAE